MTTGLLVIGASLAGLRAIETARRAGFGGSIVLVGAEEHLPYDRPPLSKQVLTGEYGAERTNLIDADGLAELDVEVRLGTRAESLDSATRTVTLVDGTAITADRILITTGATPRLLPGTEGLDGVHVVRTLDDAVDLRAALEAGPKRVVVVGAGFIGAEVASSCRTLGLDVTLIESLPLPLGRVLGPELGEFFAALHRDAGVDLRLGVGVAAVNGEGGAVSEVVLDDGSVLAADVVVVGIGVVPSTEWLLGSGLTLENGIVCDERSIAAPGIAAAGDVARWAHPTYGSVRIEHWENAIEHGRAAVKALLAEDPSEVAPYAPTPWFWSDQHGHKLQLCGHPSADDELHVLTGSLVDRKFAAVFSRDGELTGAVGVDRPRHIMQLRMLLDAGGSLAEALAKFES